MKTYFIERGQILIARDNNNNGAFDEHENMKAFADSMKGLRKISKLSLTQLGKKIGMSQQTLSTYENCKRVPSLLQALTIAAFFGFTVEDMILSGLDMREICVEDEYEMDNAHFLDK